jgi:hypothetical protein
LPTNIRQGWKSVQVANTLAYYDMTIITAVKSFIVQAADWAKFCCLATFCLSNIYIFSQIRSFKTWFVALILTINRSWVLMFWTFNLSLDILATVWATFGEFLFIFLLPLLRFNIIIK